MKTEVAWTCGDGERKHLGKEINESRRVEEKGVVVGQERHGERSLDNDLRLRVCLERLRAIVQPGEWPLGALC